MSVGSATPAIAMSILLFVLPQVATCMLKLHYLIVRITTSGLLLPGPGTVTPYSLKRLRFMVDKLTI